MVTAAHVGAGDLELDGRRYPAVADSWLPLRGDAGGAPRPDLGVYRIEPRPPLARLPLPHFAPRPGEKLLLVGCGLGRGEPVEWQGHSGWRWSAPALCRWGLNRIAGSGFDAFDAGMATRSFATLFSAGEPWEGQAAVGDSGGGVFVQRGSTWQLAGILIAVGTFPGQPAATALIGNSTHVADLSAYRAEIRKLTGLAPALPTPTVDPEGRELPRAFPFQPPPAR